MHPIRRSSSQTVSVSKRRFTEQYLTLNAFQIPAKQYKVINDIRKPAETVLICHDINRFLLPPDNESDDADEIPNQDELLALSHQKVAMTEARAYYLARQP